MRIVLVHERARLGGGGDRAACDAARALSGRGHTVVAAFADPSVEAAPAWSEAVGSRGALVSLGRGLAAPAETRAAREALAPALAEPPTWVLLSQCPNPWLLPRLPPETRVAVWVHAHAETCPRASRWLPDGSPCRRAPGLACWRAGCVGSGLRAGVWPVVRRRLLLGRARAADRVLVASGYMRDLLTELGVPRSRLRLVPYAIAEAEPLPAPSGAPRALFLGRLVPEKGGLALARAALDAGLALDVVGDGPEADAVARLARGSEGQVEFHGWLEGDRLEAAWARAALLVVPSLWPEPFGMIGPEALRRGRPVVASEVGGVRDWAHGDGVLLGPPDPAALAELAARVLGDPEELASRAAAARAWDGSRHSFAAFSDALEEALA